jgi:hypothetical protein
MSNPQHNFSHVDHQMPIGAVWRDLLELQASETATLRQGAVSYVTSEAYLLTMAAKGFATLVAEDTVVSPQEGAWAAREWHKMTAGEAGTAQMAHIMSVQNKIVAAFRNLPPQYQQQILDEVDGRTPLALEAATMVDEPDRFDDDKYVDDDD